MNIQNKIHPFPLIRLDETDSTNRYLARLCDREAVDEYTTVVTDYQTAGQGQRGNTWESERGCNLLFSFVLYPGFLEARRQFLLSQLTALAVGEELAQRAEGICIKWPNDIYWHEKKICGLLIEHELAGTHIARSIAGIGVNINQEVFRGDAPNPVSLKLITGREYDREDILRGIIARVQDYYTALQRDTQGNALEGAVADIARKYDRVLFRRTGLHPYEDARGRFNARLLRVEGDGRMVLQDEAGEERSYLFKEVQYLL